MAKKEPIFVHLDVNSEYSIGQSVIRIEDLLNKSLQYQMPALGIADNNYLFAAFKFYKLAIEIESLARRENQLVIAQEQRIKSSQAQAFWTGQGLGDGIEASELANVRCEKEAVRKAMEQNKCKFTGNKKTE